MTNWTWDGGIEFASGVGIFSGTGSPTGSVTAPVGSIYLRSDGTSGTTLYVKTTGSDNLGWSADIGGGGVDFSSPLAADTSIVWEPFNPVFPALQVSLYQDNSGLADLCNLGGSVLVVGKGETSDSSVLYSPDLGVLAVSGICLNGPLFDSTQRLRVWAPSSLALGSSGNVGDVLESLGSNGGVVWAVPRMSWGNITSGTKRGIIVNLDNSPNSFGHEGSSEWDWSNDTLANTFATTNASPSHSFMARYLGSDNSGGAGFLDKWTIGSQLGPGPFPASTFFFTHSAAESGKVSIQVPLLNSISGYQVNGGATNGYALIGDGTNFIPTAVPAAIYVIPYFGGDTGIPPKPNQILLRHSIPGGLNSVYLPVNLTGSSVRCLNAPTSNFTITMKLNNLAVGTMTILAAHTTGNFSFTTPISSIFGDVWDFVAPAVQDATIAGISFTISGTRS